MKILESIYNDYLMPNRYKEYEDFLKSFLNNNYEFICVKDYKKLENNSKKYIIIRHDIDSDIKIAKRMFEIEKNLNIKSTYYFRLCTVDKKFITEIVEYGSEVGYHYEEIAQFCKDNRMISKEFVEKNLEKIKEKMISNIKLFEENNNIKLYSIASHGDFVNRKINVTNKFIYESDLQEKLKLIEAYDIENLLDFRTADTMHPKFWKKNPKNAINENRKKVLILVHTRWWNKAPIERFKLDIKRISEHIKYKKR